MDAGILGITGDTLLGNGVLLALAFVGFWFLVRMEMNGIRKELGEIKKDLEDFEQRQRDHWDRVYAVQSSHTEKIGRIEGRLEMEKN